MFKDLQALFKRTWTAFEAEREKREPEDEVAELLSRMRREMVAARAALPEYAATVQRLRAALQREHASLAECERRGRLAAGIGDAETARVAEQFAERHRDQSHLLQRKIEAAEAEHLLRQRETEEMSRLYQEADAGRFALVAELRRARTRRSLHQLDHSFGEFARMEDAVAEQAHYAEALAALANDAEPRPHRPPKEDDVEQRLAELKRRMQQQR